MEYSYDFHHSSETVYDDERQRRQYKLASPFNFTWSALLREVCESGNAVVDAASNTIGSRGVLSADILDDSGKVNRGFW